MPDPPPESASAGYRWRARSPAPQVGAPLERPQDGAFDDLDHGDEGNRVGQDAGDVEQAEESAELEADAAAAAHQFDDQHDLPDQRQAGARGGDDEGKQLGQDNMPQRLGAPQAEYLGHLQIVAI